MTLRFWGARGSLPAPGPSTARYGGNTVCVELRCGPHLLILDAGSGLRELGAALAEDDVSVDADILLSHTHLDHICGLPFFAAMHDPKARIRFWGGHLAPPAGIAEALLTSWRAPLMPDMDAEFRAEIAFHDFIAGAVLQLRPDLYVERQPCAIPATRLATGSSGPERACATSPIPSTRRMGLIRTSSGSLRGPM